MLYRVDEKCASAPESKIGPFDFLKKKFAIRTEKGVGNNTYLEKFILKSYLASPELSPKF